MQLTPWRRLATACAVLLFAAAAAGAEEVAITIFHTNDLHQSMENLGRIARIVKEHKAKEPNAIFLDAGDYMDRGSSLVPLTRGEAMYGTMSTMGYDAWIVGNHDWIYGPERLMELMRLYPTTVLGTNLALNPGPAPKNVLKTWVRGFGGVRVGFMGMGLGNVRPTTPMYLTDVSEATRAGIEELKREKADLICVVNHLGIKPMKHERPGGYPRDLDLAKAFPEIDIIVGGHTHSLIADKLTEQYRKETGAIIVQAGASGRYLGVLKVFVDDRKKTIGRFEATNVPIEKTMPEDPEVASFLKTFYDRLMPDAKEVIAEFPERTELYNLGYWYADFLRGQTGGDVALVPRKALYDEPRSFGPGEQTVEQICAIVRNRHVVKSTVKGADLVRSLTSADVKDRLNPFHHGPSAFSGDAVYYAGMNVTYDAEADSVSLDLDPDKRYTLITLWPFQAKDAGAYRHGVPADAKPDVREPLPGLTARESTVLPETTWAIVKTAGKKGKLIVDRRYKEGPAEWKAWTERFEKKLSLPAAK